MSSIENTQSGNQTNSTSEGEGIAYLIIVGVFLYSLYAFWPLVLGTGIGFYVFKKFSSKVIRTGVGFCFIYLLGISVGFIFPTLGSKELKETYDKAPRILYPFVVPVVIGSNLEGIKIIDRNKEEKSKKLLTLKEQLKKEKILPTSIQTDRVADPNTLSFNENVALGGPTDYELLKDNSENFSVVNYPRYLILKTLTWIFSSKNDEKEVLNFRVNLILENWDFLGSKFIDNGQISFYKKYLEEEKISDIQIRILEIIK